MIDVTMAGNLNGLIAAIHTPFAETGELDLQRVSPLIEHLIEDGVAGIFVCGSTGEWPSLTPSERKRMAESCVEAADGRLNLIVHVGDNSLKQSRELAIHARAVGADGIAAVAPYYFKPPDLAALAQWCEEIAAAAELPFYYYHIPSMTGVRFPMLEFLQEAGQRVPRFSGVKYSHFDLAELQSCVEFAERRFDILFGVDEMLCSALAAGARAAVGSTYNFMAPLFNRMIEAFRKGEVERAQELQSRANEIVRLCNRFGGHAAFKAVMGLIGVPCGPVRPPQRKLTAVEMGQLEEALTGLGFFEWARQTE
jgi:N-acetylneuraminate lyase